MIDAFIDSLQAFPRGLVYVAVGLIILFLAKFVRDFVTHHSIDHEVTERGNVAVGLRLSGYYFAVILVLLGALYQPFSGGATAEGFGFDRDYAFEVLRVFLYSLAGIVALNLVRVLFDRVVLYQFHVEQEVVHDQNVGAGAAEFGMYLATALFTAGAVAGETTGGEVEAALVSLAFFGMGLVLLVVFALFYEFTTPFKIHDEIENGNWAVGVAFGGNLIAIGLVALKAVFGPFAGWGESIAAFLTYGVLGFVLLYAVRVIIDLALLHTVRVSQALAPGRNMAVAFVESSVVISSAVVLFMAI